MATSGQIVGTPHATPSLTSTAAPAGRVVPAVETLDNHNRLAVPLARYAQIIKYPEAQFFGVHRTETHQSIQSRPFWMKADRDEVARYLYEAQVMIEDEIKTFLRPTWVVGQLSDEPNNDQRLVDSSVVRRVLHGTWRHTIAAGVRAEAIISTGEAVDHASDPAEIGPISTTVTDPAEVRVRYPGSDVEIMPSSVTIADGLLTITIPRARLVKASLVNNPENGLPYEDTDNFLSTVDVYRIYNDPSTQALFFSRANSRCTLSGCNGHTQPGCIYVQSPRRSTFNVYRASYSDGTWRRTSSGICGCYHRVGLYYLSGYQVLSQVMEKAVVRLAHALMPEMPCAAPDVQMMWKQDSDIPRVATRERINCPFGMAGGSWFAWTVVSDRHVRRMGVI